MTAMNALYDAMLNKVADSCETWQEAKTSADFLRGAVVAAGWKFPPLEYSVWFHERNKRLKGAGLPLLDKQVVHGELAELKADFQVTQGEVISFRAHIKGDDWELEVELDPVALVRADDMNELLLVVEDAANHYGDEHLSYRVSSERYLAWESLPECYRKTTLRATESVYVRRAGLCRDQQTGAYLTEGAEEVAESGKKYLRERVVARRKADTKRASAERASARLADEKEFYQVLHILADYCGTWKQAEALLATLRKLDRAPRNCRIFKRQWEASRKDRGNNQ